MLYVSTCTMYNMHMIIIMWLRMCCHSFSHTNSIENNIIFTCFKPHVLVCSLWNIIKQNLIVYECPPSIVAKFINYQIREIQGQLQGALDWVWNNIHTVLFFLQLKKNSEVLSTNKTKYFPKRNNDWGSTNKCVFMVTTYQRKWVQRNKNVLCAWNKRIYQKTHKTVSAQYFF